MFKSILFAIIFSTLLSFAQTIQDLIQPINLLQDQPTKVMISDLFYSDNFSLSKNNPDSVFTVNIPLQPIEKGAAIVLKNIFFETSWKHKNLGSISQAGLVNNLNDGMVWGLFPILLASKNFDLEEIGKIVALYPIVWGLGQLFTGKMADHLNKKKMLFWGMFLQGIALMIMLFANTFTHFAILSIVLGIGTATVYPTFLAAIADYVHPQQRAESIGIFRLWRDLGYAVGALLTGFLADSLGIHWAVGTIGFLTIVSSLIILIRMQSKK